MSTQPGSGAYRRPGSSGCAEGTATASGRRGARAGFSRKAVDAGGAEISFIRGPVTGRGLLLVHGLGARAQVFSSLSPRLAADWTVLAMDLPGHGGSARARRMYSVGGYAAAVLAVLDELSEPAVVVGHSAGGWAALHVAVTRPDRVRALVLADSPIDVARLDLGAAAAEVAEAPFTLRSLSPGLSEVDPSVFDALRAGELLAGYQPWCLLRRVTCPVLLLQADPARGGLMSDADVTTALALLPRGSTAQLRGAGHALPVEDPVGMERAVRTFLDDAGVHP
jgi:pimeloyl-ACP methyl ester carboxylesterase